MSRKLVFATALAVCVAIALVPAFAAGRTDDRGDRTKQATARGGNATVPATGFSNEVRQDSFGQRTEPASTNKAEELLAAASRLTGDQALSALNQVRNLDLPEGAAGDKIRAELYRLMGEAYDGTPSKQVSMFAQALQYTSDPTDRARLEARIGALGGDAFAASFQNNGSELDTRVAGLNDTCDDPIFATLPLSLQMSIDFGDSDFVAFDVAGPDGAYFHIETLTAYPAGSYIDDTDLTLYGGCVGGVAGPQLAFDDDGGVDFMSLIDTDCLAPGTYYVEVGGWFDVTAVPDFTLEIEQTGTCILPTPDAYEPDDLRTQATDIGLPTSLPQHASGWGRAKAEIQAHSIFPANDVDNMMTKLGQNEWVSYATQLYFPTKFNGFADSTPLGYDNPDTLVVVYYENEPNYGGLCNDPPFTFDKFCYFDSDCPPPVGTPLPGFPACIPLYYFTCFSNGTPCTYPENYLAYDDDGGPGFSSRLEFCTPRPGETWADPFSMNDDWLVQVIPYSTSDTFPYEIQVRNEYSCLFESENNGYFETANDLPLNDRISGIFDASVDWYGMATGTAPDYDLYKFDVDGSKRLILHTDGYDSLACDTYLELYVGPDDMGNYYTTGVSDDDGGPGYLSYIDVMLPASADDLLGNMVADANYFVASTSIWFNLNFPYDLYSVLSEPPLTESEPNNTIAAANDVEMGKSYLASINPTCDYDVYKLALAAPAHVNAQINAGDTSMELVNCADDIRVACDDDGGVGLASMLDGCLPAGEWCYKVRAYSAYSTFSYEIAFSGGETCTPTVPPTVLGDGLYRCSPPTAFDICP